MFQCLIILLSLRPVGLIVFICGFGFFHFPFRILNGLNEKKKRLKLSRIHFVGQNGIRVMSVDSTVETQVVISYVISYRLDQ